MCGHVCHLNFWFRASGRTCQGILAGIGSTLSFRRLGLESQSGCTLKDRSMLPLPQWCRYRFPRGGVRPSGRWTTRLYTTVTQRTSLRCTLTPLSEQVGGMKVDASNSHNVRMRARLTTFTLYHLPGGGLIRHQYVATDTIILEPDGTWSYAADISGTKSVTDDAGRISRVAESATIHTSRGGKPRQGCQWRNGESNHH